MFTSLTFATKNHGVYQGLQRYLVREIERSMMVNLRVQKLFLRLL